MPCVYRSIRAPPYWSTVGGFWDQDDVDRAVAEVRGDGARPLQISLGEIWTAARRRPHLARALELFALGSAAWNLRQTFDEALRELGPQAEGFSR
jgi:hypothetical protein